MRKSARVWAAAMFAVVFVLSAVNAVAQSAVTPEQEYKKRIHVSEDISPLGENPFGESIGLYNGALSFNETDISATGTGPGIQISRSFSIPDVNPGVAFHPFHANAFVDWALDAPHIETLTAPEKVTTNGVVTYQWFLLDDFYATQRCSSLSTAPSMYVSVPGSVVTYSSDSWWHGYQLAMPGSGSQTLLRRDASNTAAPQMTNADGSAISFPIVTKDKWAVGCLAQTANGVGGEGYLAVSPDGTRYWLDWVTYRSADAVINTPGAALKRRTLMFMVSKAVDRFGNTVNYGYDGNGNLTSIQASDGRQVTLNYAQWQAPTADPGPSNSTPTTYTSFRISSIVLQPANGSPRTWTYNYTTDPTLPRLSGVQLPDGSAWSFNLGGLPATNSESLLEFTGGQGTCSYTSYPAASTMGSGTITHPSGLTGTFTAQTMIHSRSDVSEACDNVNTIGKFPNVYANTSITQKSFSGAGMVTATWNYAYSAINPSWHYQCSGCSTTSYTDMVDPAGNTTRYTFSNRFDATESLLQRTDLYAGAAGSTLVRSEITTYANPTGGPWPAKLGASQEIVVNAAQLGEWIPVSRRDIQQDGDTYTSRVDAFDAFASPTTVSRFNTFQPASSIQETTSYLNDLPHWMLGLPQQVVNVSTGEVESRNVYNLGNVTLQSHAKFGQVLMTYGFDAQGQLASFTDGNSKTTTLSNYKRGIPQSIGYPDSTSQSISVDDFGQIASITNQQGHTTSYVYDAVGRVTNITYPAGDALTCAGDAGPWSARNFYYEAVGSERGITGAHWRRTVIQGARVQVTYFDAMLRPILASSYRGGDNAYETTVRNDFDWRGSKTFVGTPQAGVPGIGNYWAGVATNYDALARPYRSFQTSELGDLLTSMSYLSGARKQVTDPKGYITTTAYQAFDAPSYDNPIQVTAPEGVTQQIARDIYGNPTSIAQSGPGGAIAKTMVYDSYYRLCRTTEPESGSEVMAYDAANNLAWSASGLAITGAGCGQEQVATAARTTRGYDPMNRVTSIVYPSGTDSSSFTYDALGNISTATSGLVSWTYGHNDLGLLTTERLDVDGREWTLAYGYDPNQALSTTQYPDGKCLAYNPDALGRPNQVGTYAGNVSYFPDGDLQSFTLGSGASYVAQKNARNMVSNFSYGVGSTIAVSEDFAYDANANVTSITDLTNGGQRTKSLQYDTLNRLVSATASNLWGTESYTYDALNNIRSLTNTSGTNTYNYDGNNLLSSITNGASTVHSFQYDPRGNTVSKDSVPLTFDQANRLTSIQGKDSYLYDAAGRRVKKQPTGSTPATYYAYNSAGQLMWEFDPSTTNGTDYLYLGKKLVAMTQVVTSAVIGHVDGVVNPTNPTASLQGWTCSDGFTDSLSVRVYVGGAPGAGTLLGTYTANLASGTDIAAQCHTTGSTYRFSVDLTDATRIAYPNASIYVVGVGLARIGGSDATLSGSGSYTVPASVSAPAPPSSVTAAVAGNLASITVSWPVSATATSYSVKQQYNGAWGTAFNVTGTSTTVSNPADGGYVYSVSACNANGCSAATNSSAATVAHSPPAPASISVPGTSTGIVGVSWAAATYATVYELEQSLNGGPWNAVYHAGGTSASINVGVTANAVYRVQACNANGCSAFINSGTVIVTVPPTAAPSISGGGTSTSGAYTIAWNGVAGATYYVLIESANGGGWTTVQSNGAGSWSTSGRGNGSYVYQVQGCNAGGCGPWSGQVTVTVALIPPTPTGLTLTTTGNWTKPTIHLTWNASAGATSYNVEYTNPPYAPVVQNYTTNAYNLLTYANGTVEYRVQACNASGCSAWSGYVTTQLQSGG